MAATSRDDAEPSIKELVQSATQDISTLVSDQIELTKTELRSAGKNAGKGAGMLAGAAFVAVLFIVFLLIAIANGLIALGLPVWAGYLIVAVVLAIIAAIVGMLGKKNLERVKGPEQAIAELQATKAALTSGGSGSADTSAAA